MLGLFAAVDDWTKVAVHPTKTGQNKRIRLVLKMVATTKVLWHQHG